MKQRYSQSHDRMRAVLKRARIEAGLTQSELCDELGRDRNFVSTVEIGTRMLDVLEFADYAVGVKRRPVELYAEVIKPGKVKPIERQRVKHSKKARGAK